MCQKCGIPDHVDISAIGSAPEVVSLSCRNVIAAGAVLSAMPIIAMGGSAFAQSATTEGIPHAAMRRAL